MSVGDRGIAHAFREAGTMNAARRVYLASVLALLTASNATMAVSLSRTVNAVTAGRSLVVAGSAAQRDVFLRVMALTVCQMGTFNVYRASPTSGQDFRAYSCQLAPIDPFSPNPI